MIDAYQYNKPAGFPELPDSVTLAGKTFTGTRAKVYWLLEITRQRNFQHRIGQQLGPAGWVPRFLVVEPWSGGGQGDRRLRELRQEYGCSIEDQAFQSGGTTLYRMADVPAATAFPRRHTPQPATASGPDGDDRRHDPHAPPAGPPDVIPSAPLAGVRFWTCVGARGLQEAPSTVLQVDPGAECAIAPSLRIVRKIAKGEQDTARLDQDYLSELRAAREVGELLPVFTGLGAVVLSIETASPWNPLPMLTYALTRLGAQHAGDLSTEAA